MTIEDYDIVGSYDNQRITAIDAERSVNLFEYLDQRGKKPKSLISTAGLLNSGLIFPNSAPGDAARAQYVVNLGSSQLMFYVIGQNVYVCDQTLTVSQINTSPLTAAVGYVGIEANNGNSGGQIQVIFVDGQQGYIYNVVTRVWQQILDTSFPVLPIDVCYLDGFFIVANGNTNQFQLSQLNEGLIWGPAQDTFTADDVANVITIANTANYPTGIPITVSNSGGALPSPLTPAPTVYYTIRVSATTLQLATTYANAIAGTPIVLTSNGTGTQTILSEGQLQEGQITSHPGTIVACRTLHRQVFFFSEFFTEVWENLGVGTNLPLRRNNGLLIEYGTPAIGSIAVGFDRMFFLSQDRDGLGSVMGVSGSQAIPVSNRALEFALAAYMFDPKIGVADARAFLIKESGLIFYRLNFTNANHTYVFGVSMSDEQNPRWHEEEVLNGNRHPAQTHGFFYGRNYVGSYNSNISYIVSADYFSNDGESIRRMRIGRPIMKPTSQRTRIDRFQLDLLQGQLSEAPGITEDLDLLTEDDLILETEAGDDILVETPLVIFNSNNPPVVFLSISKDGGQSYGYRQQAPMGAVGQRSFRTLWRKQGVIPRGQAFVPKIEFFNQTPFIILGATWVYETMPE